MKYIAYLDKYNLYSYAMSKFLSTVRFKDLDPAKSDLYQYNDDSLKVSVLEVDLEEIKELELNKLKELHEWRNYTNYTMIIL